MNNKIMNSVSFFKLQYHFLKGNDYWIFLFAIIGSFGTGIALPLFALFFGDTLTRLNLITSTGDFVNEFFDLLVKFLVVGAGTLIGGILMYTLWSYLGRIISKRMKEEYFQLIMKKSQNWFDSINTYEYSFKMQDQIKAVENGIGEKTGHTIMAITMFIASFVVSYYTSWKLSLVISSVIPFFLFGGYLITCLTRERGKRMKETYEKAGGIAEEVIYFIKTVLSFANNEYEIERFKKSLNESFDYAISQGTRTSIMMGAYFFVIFGTFALAIWYGSVLRSEGEVNPRTGYRLSVGEILVVMFTVIFGSLSLGQASPNIKAINTACLAATDFFSMKESYHEEEHKYQNIDIIGNVTFKNVSFAYQSKPDKLVVNDVTFEACVGRKTILVGENGAGKSTIGYLIEKFYEPSSGQILIDGVDIKLIDSNQLRSIIGYAPQEPVIFNTSILENIRFGRNNLTEEDVLEACRKAYAIDFVKSKGLDFNVGFKGNRLSCGQRQRIALARAMVGKPKILLLDEGTSALDFKSEQEVITAIDEISKTTTVISILNRLNTISEADNIIVLKDGKVVEQGDHNNLIQLQGIYSVLVSSLLEKKQNNKHDINDEILNLNKSIKTNEDEKNKLQSEEIVRETHVNHKNESINIKIAKEVGQKLWPLLMENKALVALSVFFASCTGAIWPSYGILLAAIVDAVQQNDKVILLRNGAAMAGWLLLLAGIAGLSVALQNYFLVRLGEKLTKTLRIRVFEKFLKFNMTFYDRPENNAGSLLTRLSSDTAKINGIAVSMVGVSIQMIVTVIVGVSLSFVYSWKIALINLAFFPLIIISTICMMKAQKNISSNVQEAENKSGTLLTDSICNTKTVNAYNMQEKTLIMYQDILEGMRRVTIKLSVINGISFGIMMLIMFFDFGIMLYAGSVFIFQDLSIRNFLSSVFPLLFTIFGLAQGQQYVGDISKAKQAIYHIFNILDENIPYNVIKSENGQINGKIEFKNVEFCYPSRPDVKVLNNVSFIINPGQHVGLIGFSGSGKSTIIQLLERFYEPTSGQILIDDRDIKTYEISHLRHSLALLMEEPILFARTFKDNIKYGKLSATDQEVEEYAKKASIYDILDGKQTSVSGGEKQRLCLARSMIKNPNIVLLDEPTSALDLNSEKAVQEKIEEMTVGKTVIQIAHR